MRKVKVAGTDIAVDERSSSCSYHSVLDAQDHVLGGTPPL